MKKDNKKIHLPDFQKKLKITEKIGNRKFKPRAKKASYSTEPTSSIQSLIV